MKLDTVSLVETPEGTDLQAEVVGIVPRALAYCIDFLVRFAAISVLSILISLLGMGLGGAGLMLIVYFLLEWWYPVIFEVYRGGQTIGKKSMGIKVVNDDLTPIRMGASLTRNLLRVADVFPLFYVTGTISIMTTQRFQRLGDLAANTIVVYEHDQRYDVSQLENVKSVAPSAQLNEELQIAFINFALNRGGLSQARQAEIAEIIRPRLSERATDSVAHVRGIGKWLLGSK